MSDVTTTVIDNVGGWFATFTTAAFGAWIAWYSKRADRQERTDTKEIAVSDGWMEMARYLEQRLTMLEDEVRAARAEMSEMAGRERQMLWDLRRIHDWAEAGAVPPPPDRPKYLLGE